MPPPDCGRVPSSTFRVQLHRGFTFSALANRIAYLRTLGISDVYLSPIFTASPGSTHGYDVNDYLSINPELGGEEAFVQLSDKLADREMGLLLDIVPNHMGISGPLNAWWQDVLENGEESAYAPFFDIHWNTPGDKGRHRVLVPMLPDQYGAILERGELQLVYTNAFFLQYGTTLLPISPSSYGTILQPLLENPELKPENRREVETIWSDYLNLPSANAAADPKVARLRHESVIRLKSRLALWFDSQPDLRSCLNAQLQAINGKPGDPRSYDVLDGLIEQQHYRIARWKTGAHEINYRRFFAIDSLVGVHEEDPAVFRECHRLVKRLVREGHITGLRIDHIDGLRQPKEYLERLQEFERPESHRPLYTIVEKILARDEQLPVDWKVHGTTGYEFIPQLASILVNGVAEEQLNETYRRFAGASTDYPEEVYAKKRQILDELFENAVNTLGTDLAEIIADDRHWKDMTRHELIIAVREVIANLSTYRSYRSTQAPLPQNEADVVNAACTAAIARNPSLDPEPFEFVRDAVLGTYPPSGSPETLSKRILDWVLTFQQYTGAVMAKSVEDTAFYTYCRFIALNEVGSEAGSMGDSVDAFHAANSARLASWPHSLLATSTHDTKVSEDVRARLYALSEVPEKWDKAVDRWHAFNKRFISDVDGGPVPDPIDEYRFYQTLIGAWPLDPTDINEAFRQRLRGHIRKAVDEAKRHTSILQHNERYHAGCLKFVDAITDPSISPEFFADFAAFAQRIAYIGLGNSLTQVVLKCTVPGVPDLYQGNEVWDFSLVDPDNRREIDFERRVQLMEEIKDQPVATLLERWRDGGIKLRITQLLLNLRLTYPLLFSEGSYQALKATGAHREQLVTFRRQHAETGIIVIVPRLSSAIGSPAIGVGWDDTELEAPGGPRPWTNLFTNETLEANAPLKLRSVLASLPFAVLIQGTQPE